MVAHGERFKTVQFGVAEQFTVFNNEVAKAADFFSSSELAKLAGVIEVREAIADSDCVEESGSTTTEKVERVDAFKLS